MGFLHEHREMGGAHPIKALENVLILLINLYLNYNISRGSNFMYQITGTKQDIRNIQWTYSEKATKIRQKHKWN